MWILVLFAIGVVVLIILVVTLIVAKKYVVYAPPVADPSKMAAQYHVNSAWGWGADGRSAPAPVPGIEGKCNVYTFTSSEQYAPAIATFSDINTCVGNTGACASGTCSCSSPSGDQSCIDDDQLFAARYQHRCMGDMGYLLKTSGKCLQQNGQLADKGTVEQYFTVCSLKGGGDGSVAAKNTTRCQGSLSLVAFNVSQGSVGRGIFAGAVCMSTPQYTTSKSASGAVVYSGLGPLTQEICDMSASYNSYPSQLFRVERATFDGVKFTNTDSGPFVRMIHRPTGYSVSPTLSAAGIPTGNLELVPTKGFQWALLPQIKDPDGSGNGSRPQIIYIPDASKYPGPSLTPKLKAYLTSNTLLVYSIQPTLAYGNYSVLPVSQKLLVKPYIYTNFDIPEYQGGDPQGPSKVSVTQILDYSTLPMMMQNPSNFDFFGPFSS